MKSYITFAYDTHDLDRASASTLSLPRMRFISGLEPCRNKLHRIRYGYYMDRIIELVKQTLEVAAATPCHQERTPDALPFGHTTPSSVLGLPPSSASPAHMPCSALTENGKQSLANLWRGTGLPTISLSNVHRAPHSMTEHQFSWTKAKGLLSDLSSCKEEQRGSLIPISLKLLTVGS